jgi:complement component 1 Q subcomponent-binding protein
MCQEGTFIVDNISFYADGKLGTELTAEADWKRRGLYIGPQFDTLDVGVQEEFEKFLQERGVNENLALFIPEYSESKEQKVRDLFNDSLHPSNSGFRNT